MVDAARLARHSDAMLPTEGMGDRGPLRIPIDRLHEQGGAGSAESLVEEVRRVSPDVYAVVFMIVCCSY